MNDVFNKRRLSSSDVSPRYRIIIATQTSCRELESFEMKRAADCCVRVCDGVFMCVLGVQTNSTFSITINVS